MLFVTVGIAILAGGALFAGRALAPCAPAVALADSYVPGGSTSCGPVIAADSEPARPLAPAVTVAPAARRLFAERLFVSGSLAPREEAMVGAQLDGLRLTEILVDEGDRVEKGQVLARLDRSQLDALLAQNDAAAQSAEAAIAQAKSQIAQFEASLAQASADLDRARKLGPGIMTEATFDQRIAAARIAEAQRDAGRNALRVAEASLASRQAERRELMVRIDRADVRAPEAGVISRRTARLGAVASGAGDALFRIIVDGAIDLDAEAPEQSLARFAVGMPASIMLPGAATPTAGKVRLIAAEVDKTTRLGKVRIALDADPRARIGAFASGTVLADQREGIGVPTSALQRLDDGDYVQVVENDRIVARKIVVGIIDNDAAEARAGLERGDSVVTRAAAFLRPGDIVRPMLAAAGAAKVQEAAK
jgi:RND family efflux transporter MFP subunit